MIKVLCVCLGNICRSPTAEGVLQRKIKTSSLQKRIEVDSCGTSNYHPNSPPDKRTQQVALRSGYDLGGLRARQIRAQDFIEFDYILAMDKQNLKDLQCLCPPEYHHKLHLFLSFSACCAYAEVPDPYYGTLDDFAQVLALCEEAADGFLRSIH